MSQTSPKKKRAFRLRAPLFLGAILLTVGTFLGNLSDPIFRCWNWIYWGCWGLVLFLATLWYLARVAWHRDLSWIIGILLLGWLHGQSAQLWQRLDDVQQINPKLSNPNANWTGRVASLPDPRKTFTQFTFAIQKVDYGQGPEPCSGQILVRLHRIPADQEITYDEVLTLRGLLEPPSVALNPGQLDYQQYLSNHDIHFILSAEFSEAQIVAQGPSWNPVNWAAKVRKWARHELAVGLSHDPVVVAVLTGMLFGDTTQIPPSVDSAFRNTGTYHIFAVSGQNLAELLALGLLFIQFLGLVRWRWGWLLAPVLYFFCLISDNQPSIIRALIMGLFVLSGWRLNRPISPLNIWSATLILVILNNPKSMLDLGFILSFAVVLALLLFASPLVNLLKGPFKVDPFIPRRLIPPLMKWKSELGIGIATLVGTSLAAWVGSAPLMALFFHQCSPISLLANLVVVPMAGVIVVVGTLSLLLGVVCPPITLLLNNANWLFVKILIGGVMGMAHWPDASLYVADPLHWGSPRDPEFIVTATTGPQEMVIRYRNQNWLINPGSESDYRYLVNPLRKFLGINQFDGVILDSLTPAAIGGTLTLQGEIPVKKWFTPLGPTRSKKVETILQVLPTNQVGEGFSYHFDKDFFMEVLAPQPNPDFSQAFGNHLVLLFCYQGRRLLMAGPTGFGLEQLLTHENKLPGVEVLVQSPQVDEPGLSLDWLNALHPNYLIYGSSGKNHSSSLLSSSGRTSNRMKTFDQNRTGAVEIRLSPQATQVTPFLKGN